MLAGTNLIVTDNDIYSSGDVVSTRNNGAAGASYMHIARNRFWNGGTTHWCVLSILSFFFFPFRFLFFSFSFLVSCRSLDLL